MNVVDLAIIAIILVSLGVGLFRGFVHEMLSLAAWGVALWVAYGYAHAGGVYLEPYIAQPPLPVVAAFAVIFVVVLIAASILGYLLSRLLPLGISGVGRFLGMLFGAARGVVVVALLLLAATFMDMTSQPWWEESMLMHYFVPVADGLRALMPEDMTVYFRPPAEPV